MGTKSLATVYGASQLFEVPFVADALARAIRCFRRDATRWDMANLVISIKPEGLKKVAGSFAENLKLPAIAQRDRIDEQVAIDFAREAGLARVMQRALIDHLHTGGRDTDTVHFSFHLQWRRNGRHFYGSSMSDYVDLREYNLRLKKRKR